jgi:class 3 adenylate cyclase/CHASE2 domain-containing sensor protein
VRAPLHFNFAFLNPRAPVRRWHRVALITFGISLACAYLDNFTRTFEYFEQRAGGDRAKVYERVNEPLASLAKRKIVLVELNDSTFQDPAFKALGGPPLPRGFHARVIRELSAAGAKVVAFDFVFDSHKPEDQELAQAAREAESKGTRVLWACLVEGRDPLRAILPNATLRNAAPHYGHVGVLEDVEQPAIERVAPVMRASGKELVQISLQAARASLGLSTSPLRKEDDAWRCGPLRIPVGINGAFQFSYFGAPREAFPIYPYEDIYGGAAHDRFAREQKFFQNKIVFVGDATEFSHDYRTTPQGRMAGVEILAHIAATILQNAITREAPLWANLLALLLLSVAAAWLAASFKVRLAALGVLLILCCYGVGNVWLFVAHGVALHLVAPCIAAALVAAGVLNERGSSEEREKQRMRELLMRSMSPQIANYVANNPDKCVLGGGEHITASVLFSDIRGFTALSERLSPEALVARLNEYFQVMTDVVFKYEGTSASFIGDALMVLFGVPLPREDHAHRAVATAMEMQSELLKLQAKWKAEGVPSFDVGIGINSGELVAGQVGARQRMDFTVYGPAVNLASRIEGLNKEFNTRILISAATYELVKEEIEVGGSWCTGVRGVVEDIMVYEVQGWKDSFALPSLAPVEHAAGRRERPRLRLRRL